LSLEDIGLAAWLNLQVAPQFGFDMYFNAIGASLSSMYQATDGGDLISASLTFTF
jgi:hypothetical protein